MDSNRNYSSGPGWKILCNYSLNYISRPLELQCKQTVIPVLDHWNYSVKYSVLYRETNMFLLRNQNDTMIEYLKLWNFIKVQITVTWTYNYYDLLNVITMKIALKLKKKIKHWYYMEHTRNQIWTILCTLVWLNITSRFTNWRIIWCFLCRVKSKRLATYTAKPKWHHGKKIK